MVYVNMLEGLINNNSDTENELFIFNTKQIYYMTKTEDENIDTYITKYKSEYNLSLIDVYVNMALVHGHTE